MLASDAIVIGFQSEIKNKFTGFASHIVISKTKTNFAYQAEPILMNKKLEENVLKIFGVAHIQPGGLKLGILKTETDNEGVILKGVGKNFNWDFYKDNFISGKQFSVNDSVASTQICITKIIADKLNLKVNDKVRMYFLFEKSSDILNRVFTIHGIYETGIEDIDKKYILADFRHVQQLNGWRENEAGGYEVFLKDFKQTDVVNSQIQDLLEPKDYISTRTIQERYPQIFDWLGLLDVNVFIILSLMLVVGAINMITALLVMILERTSMIGALKAMGARDGSIINIFVYNAMFVILAGIVCGDILSLGFLSIQQQFHILHLPQESYYLSYVPVHFDWVRIALINLGALVFCTLSMLLPGLIVLRVKPAKALRFE